MQGCSDDEMAVVMEPGESIVFSYEGKNLEERTWGEDTAASYQDSGLSIVMRQHGFS